MNGKEWFKQARFGMMVHFGLYSILGGEWRGRRMGQGDIGEWIQAQFRIPNAEYHQLRRVFNPICFSAREWVDLAKEAGMQYIVVTSKHHEGFALFDSEYDSFNSVKGTPFGRDIIEELAEECYRQGLRLGLYYSQDIDWSHPDGGGYDATVPHVSAGTWCNDWDYPDASKKDYTRLFETKIKTQMKEILTKYGDLCLVWCDTPMSISREQSEELLRMIKHYQPDCLVNSRIGNGMGDYCSWGDNQIPDERMVEGLFETPATLNDTWGYKSYDCNWKSAEQVLAIKRHLNERGINYLLNVGPDHLGRIPAPSVDILRTVGRMDK